MERICEGRVDMTHGLLAIHGGVDEEGIVATTAAIPPPQTPVEPMVSRSWSVSAEEISRALLLKGGVGGVKHGRKEKARSDRAQVHAMVSVAQVSAAVAAVTAATSCDNHDSKIAAAMASATKLLASHSAEIAQLAGAGHEQVTSAVRSAVDVASPGDLMTLTAAAATALRGAATLKKRVQRETRRSASILPYEKAPSLSPDIWCKEGKRCGLCGTQ